MKAISNLKKIYILTGILIVVLIISAIFIFGEKDETHKKNNEEKEAKVEEVIKDKKENKITKGKEIGELTEGPMLDFIKRYYEIIRTEDKEALESIVTDTSKITDQDFPLKNTINGYDSMKVFIKTTKEEGTWILLVKSYIKLQNKEILLPDLKRFIIHENPETKEIKLINGDISEELYKEWEDVREIEEVKKLIEDVNIELENIAGENEEIQELIETAESPIETEEFNNPDEENHEEIEE